MQYPKLSIFVVIFMTVLGVDGVERDWLKLEIQKIFWINWTTFDLERREYGEFNGLQCEGR